MRYLLISLLLSGCAVDPIMVNRFIMYLPYNDPFFVSQKFGKDLHGDPEIKVKLNKATREALK